jgi:antitoxin (DNA-binding transcriptional repressor) of toxin-antitoxin stability system
MIAQLAPSRMSLPPPPMLAIVDRDRTVGWLDDDGAFGLGGFAHAREAMDAAFVAWRTVSRARARELGRRPVPIDAQPLALARDDDRVVITASGRPFAELLPAGAHPWSNFDSYGFAIRMEPLPDEERGRELARTAYRAVRKSGVPWSLFRPRPFPLPSSQWASVEAVANGVRRVLSPAFSFAARLHSIREDSIVGGAAGGRGPKPLDTAVPSIARTSDSAISCVGQIAGFPLGCHSPEASLRDHSL